MTIDELYSPELFQRVSELLTHEITRYLKDARTPPFSVRRSKTPAELVIEARAALFSTQNGRCANEIVAAAKTLFDRVLTQTTRLHSPYYMGHQVNPPVPLASLMQAIGGVLNPGLAVYEMSQFPLAIEKALIGELVSRVGWEHGDGIITSGGTLANLTALLAARQWKYPHVFKEGLGPHRPAILTGADSHYSITRAAGVMGMGTDQVLKLPLDERRRVDPKKIEAVYDQAVADGLEPFAIAGTSGSTPVGAFDPLAEIAAFAHAKGLWFHVDGAHGASFLLSDQHRHQMQGIEHADSATWDAHKMMFVPSLCTFVLYKDRKNSFLPFQQDAPYLFDAENELVANYDLGLRTFECTKGAIALPLWTLWSLFGEKVFALLIDQTVATTRTFYEMIRASDDFAALNDPQANILCFRYLPHQLKGMKPDEISRVQSAIRQRLVQEGKFFITGTRLEGAYALRVTLMNPTIKESDLGALLEEIRRIGMPANG